jgi:predicted ATPase
LDIARAQNEGWCLPEVLRVQASVLTAQHRANDAETLLVEAMALAEQTGALSWQLRAANDLAKLWHSRSRTDEARHLLLPIYNRFSEGFGTRDLVVAAALIG